MRCSACSAAVMHALKSNKDIKNPSLNAITGLAEFEAEENFSSDEIIAEINALGYKAQNKEDANSLLNKDNYFNLPELFVLIFFSVLELYLSMMNMFMVHGALPDFLSIMHNPAGFAVAALILAIPIMIIGLKFFIPGIRSLIRLRPNMESLVSIGAIVAFVYSLVFTIIIFFDEASAQEDAMNIIYDSATMVILFVYIGKYIEQINNNKAKSAINNLISILPTDANVIRDNKVESVCINDVHIDDIVIVKPGERSPVDGIVVNGESEIDTSSITGESKAISIHKDDEILAGSIVLNGTLEIQAIKTTSDATLNNILYLVSKSQFSKSKVAKLIDAISFWFVPTIIFISLIAFISWISITHDFKFSIIIFVSTLVVACPCSIGLAIPLANVNATTTAIKNGFVYRNVDIASKLNKINTFVFDKTGTLTNGKFMVKEFKVLDKNLDKNEVLSFTSALESSSNHPIANSLVKFAKENGNIDNAIKINSTLLPGKGLEGNYNGDIYYLGNTRNIISSEKLDESLLYLTKNGQVIASFSIIDEIETGASELIKYLKEKKYRIIMLTGDGEETAKRVARQVGISEYKSKMYPSEKFEYITNLKKDGAHICYIGDGINDAPSLSLSDLSISPYMSSDIATDSSDVYLLKSDLSVIKDVLGLTKLTGNIINLNILWAFGYNIVAMIIATGMFYSLDGLKLDPWMSALAMSISSISVVLTSLLIKLYKSKRDQ